MKDTGTTLEAVAGDAAAIIEVAKASTEPRTLSTVGMSATSIAVPEGAQLVIADMERYQPLPNRRSGTAQLDNVGAFVSYVEGFASERTTVWVDVERREVVAVLDDYGRTTTDDAELGWADHRAELKLVTSEEWDLWTEHDGDYMSQEAFANLVEDGIKEIREPDGAVMLEIAQSFHAKTSATFRKGVRLQDGRVQLSYDEEIEAKAGGSGQLDIPSEFLLGLRVFEGEVTAAPVRARLRYRASAGKLALGYKLERPGEILRASVAEIAATLGESFDRVYVGRPGTRNTHVSAGPVGLVK